MSYIDDYLPKLYQWEQAVQYMYKDSKGLMTTLVGVMLPNLAASLALPWYIADSSRPATPAEVTADWTRVSQMPGNHRASFYRSPNGLVIRKQDLDAITRARVLANDAELARDFPSYATAPPPAKIAHLDMDWNLGEPRLRSTYPHYDLCFDRSDWLGCKAECLRDKDDPAFKLRNAWTQVLFDQAMSYGGSN